MFDSRETILKEFTKEVSWGGELGRWVSENMWYTPYNSSF
jgi:hypothetical protein